MRVCPRTLRKERQAGRLTYIRIGRGVKYDPADLIAYVEGAKICQSENEKAPRSIGTRSAWEVIDFAAAREKRASEKQRK